MMRSKLALTLAPLAAAATLTAALLHSPTAEARMGGAPGMRCAPAPGTPGPAYDMTKKNGRASAKRQEFQPDQINLHITGDAAELIYKDLLPKRIYETEFEGGVIQLVGPNMTCYEQTKKMRNGKTKKRYSCDIGIKEGATTEGAAG